MSPRARPPARGPIRGVSGTGAGATINGAAGRIFRRLVQEAFKKALGTGPDAHPPPEGRDGDEEPGEPFSASAVCPARKETFYRVCPFP